MKNRLQGLIVGILIGSTLTGGMVLARTGSEAVRSIREDFNSQCEYI